MAIDERILADRDGDWACYSLPRLLSKWHPCVIPPTSVSLICIVLPLDRSLMGATALFTPDSRAGTVGCSSRSRAVFGLGAL